MPVRTKISMVTRAPDSASKSTSIGSDTPAGALAGRAAAHHADRGDLLAEQEARGVGLVDDRVADHELGVEELRDRGVAVGAVQHQGRAELVAGDHLLQRGVLVVEAAHEADLDQAAAQLGLAAVARRQRWRPRWSAASRTARACRPRGRPGPAPRAPRPGLAITTASTSSAAIAASGVGDHPGADRVGDAVRPARPRSR